MLLLLLLFFVLLRSSSSSSSQLASQHIQFLGVRMVYNGTGCGLKRGSLLPTLWACEGQKDLSEGASIPLRGHWFCVRATRCRRLAVGCVCVFYVFLDECVSTNFKMILLQNQFQNDEVVWDPHFGLSTAQQNRRSLH